MYDLDELLIGARTVTGIGAAAVSRRCLMLLIASSGNADVSRTRSAANGDRFCASPQSRRRCHNARLTPPADSRLATPSSSAIPLTQRAHMLRNRNSVATTCGWLRRDTVNGILPFNSGENGQYATDEGG
jgi:hypothetical protein